MHTAGDAEFLVVAWNNNHQTLHGRGNEPHVAMFEAERRGYTLIMTVHDDLLCEVDDGFGTPAELQEIMTRKPAWIDGFLPLSAKCWEGKRNAK